jgi:hypothetical protein
MARENKPKPKESEPVIEESPDIPGPECPECGCRHAPLVQPLPTLGQSKKIRTRHECRYCGRRFVFMRDASVMLGGGHRGV